MEQAMTDKILSISSKNLSSSAFPVTFSDFSMMYNPRTNEYAFMGPGEQKANDGIFCLMSQSNAGVDENGNWFHSVDNPLEGTTTTTVIDEVTGETTVTVHPKRHR